MDVRNIVPFIVVVSTFLLLWCASLVLPLVVIISIWYCTSKIVLLLSAAYCVWMFVDRRTAFQGGRYSEWVRRWPIWKWWTQYFSLQLIKTTDLDPSRNYIFGYHPHGMTAVGAFGNFATDATGFSHLFPGIRSRLTTLRIQFINPLTREVVLPLGLCSVSQSSCEYILSGKCGQGNALVILVGGQREIWMAKKDTMKLYLKSRKGFIRLALKYGASLVPVISFGENDILLSEVFTRVMPFVRGIITVVGKPISVSQIDNPTSADIDELHNKYIQALEQLFMEQKNKWGHSNTNLEII